MTETTATERAAPPMRATLHIVLPPPKVVAYDTRFFVVGEPAAIDGHRHEYGFRSLRCENATARYRCRAEPPGRGYERGDLDRAQRDSFRALALAALRERYDLMLSLDYPLTMPEDNGDDFPWRWLRGSAGNWWSPPIVEIRCT